MRIRNLYISECVEKSHSSRKLKCPDIYQTTLVCLLSLLLFRSLFNLLALQHNGLYCICHLLSLGIHVSYIAIDIMKKHFLFLDQVQKIEWLIYYHCGDATAHNLGKSLKLALARLAYIKLTFFGFGFHNSPRTQALCSRFAGDRPRALRLRKNKVTSLSLIIHLLCPSCPLKAYRGPKTW